MYTKEELKNIVKEKANSNASMRGVLGSNGTAWGDPGIEFTYESMATLFNNLLSKTGVYKRVTFTGTTVNVDGIERYPIISLYETGEYHKIMPLETVKYNQSRKSLSISNLPQGRYELIIVY